MFSINEISLNISSDFSQIGKDMSSVEYIKRQGEMQKCMNSLKESGDLSFIGCYGLDGNRIDRYSVFVRFKTKDCYKAEDIILLIDRTKNMISVAFEKHMINGEEFFND